jgi:hypothetical protein
MRYVAGELLNFLEKARLITPSPAANVLFPVSSLYDGYSDAIFRFGSNAADPSLTFDLAMKDKDDVDNGDLNTWSAGSPVGFTKTTTGTGTAAETAVAGEIVSGSAAKLNKGSGTAKLVKTYKVRTGSRWNYSLSMRIAASGHAKAQLYNPITKKYLTGAGAWQSAQAYFATENASAVHVAKTGSFTVESYSTHQGPMTYLELTVLDDGGGAAGDFSFFDDLFFWPSWNAVVISGHNIEAGMTLSLRSSTDAFVGSNDEEVALSMRRPAFYGYDSGGVSRRWARLAFTGTQSDIAGAAYAGEIVLTYLETAPDIGPADGYSMRRIPDNVQNSAPGGRIIASRTNDERRRAFQFSFPDTQTAELATLEDELHGRAHGALFPVVIVPDNSQDVVCHGRLSDDWEVKRLFASTWDSDLLLAENPMPRVTS